MSFGPDGEWLARGATDPASHKITFDIANDGQLASTAAGRARIPLFMFMCVNDVYPDDLKYKEFYSGTRASRRSSQLTSHGNTLI
jgi:hypothetical protein